MSIKSLLIFASIAILVLLQRIFCTTDLNAAELQYLADHLTPEECRRLVAAAHFKTYQEPNALDQAERKISKDLPCIDLLHHWNSQPGEGKGETHELLEHRLRQMGKYELADWLGKTVFHELAMDLNRSLGEGLHAFATEESSEEAVVGPSLAPVIEDNDPTKWTAVDTLLYNVIIGLIIVIIGISCKVCYAIFQRYKVKRKKRKVKFKTPQAYEILDGDISDLESENKFDVRDYTENKNLLTSTTDEEK